MYRLKLILRCSLVQTMSARRTHKVPCVQFAFSDDTALSESVERAANTRFYPNRIRCNLLWVKLIEIGLPTSGHG
jgi:hypothetical protein